MTGGITTINFRGQEAEIWYDLSGGDVVGWSFLDPAFREAEFTAEEDHEIWDQVVLNAAKREWPHGS